MKNNKMKNIVMKIVGALSVSILLSLGFFEQACGQTEKGLWQVGGSVGFNRDEGSNFLTVNPAAGYFITNHLVLGGGISISYFNSDYSKTLGTGFYPYASYYFGKGKLQPLVSVAASVSYVNYDYDDNSFEYSSSEWNTGLVSSAGVSYFLNENAAIEGVLGYSFSSKNLFLSFGFEIYLGKRTE